MFCKEAVLNDWKRNEEEIFQDKYKDFRKHIAKGAPFSKITDLRPTASSKNGTNSTLDVSMKF